MIIYALVDPRDYAPHYIGVTEDIYKAFIGHLRESTKETRVNLWVEGLRRLYLVPILKTLEATGDPALARKRQEYWIQHYQYLGHDLLNATLPPSKTKQEATLETEPPEGTKLLGLTYTQAARLPECRRRGVSISDIRQAIKRGAIKTKSDGSITKNSVRSWLRSLSQA